MEHRALERRSRSAARAGVVALALALLAFRAPEERGRHVGGAATATHQDVRRAPVRGRALDRDTGEPIPFLGLTVSGRRGRPEVVETDASGRFVTKRDFPAGTLRIRHGVEPPGPTGWSIVVEDMLESEHEHVVEGDGPGRELEVVVTIGPTYTLDLELPEGVAFDDLVALFPRRSKGIREFHSLAADDPGSPMSLFVNATSDPGVLEERAPIHAGPPVWVCFRAPVVPEGLPRAHAEHGLLHVRSRDGRWDGSAAVPSRVGVHRDALRVALVRCGTLEGRVVDSDGEPVPTAWVQRLDDASPEGVLEELGADREGGFRFDALPPGEQLVRVLTERYAPWLGRVEVRAGEATPLEVVLTSPSSLGVVSGLLRSRTGRHRSKGAVVMLQNTGESRVFFLRSVRWREVDGEFVAPFEIADVPQGEYTLELRPLDNRRWERLRQVVVAPAEGVEFLCLDEGPTLELEFRAVDARDGSPLARAHSLVWHGEPVDELRLDDDWETQRYLGVPADSPLTWVVRADGYQLAWGDDGAIPDVGEPRVVEVRLAPGWGQVFKVTTREREPLAGVELVVDGESVGRTDVQGLIAASRASRPTSLAFRREGWHVSWGRVDPAAEDFDQGLETPVYLERD